MEGLEAALGSRSALEGASPPAFRHATPPPSGSSAPEAGRLRLEDARSIAIVNIHTVEKETEQNVTWYRNDPGAYQDG